MDTLAELKEKHSFGGSVPWGEFAKSCPAALARPTDPMGRAEATVAALRPPPAPLEPTKSTAPLVPASPSSAGAQAAMSACGGAPPKLVWPYDQVVQVWRQLVGFGSSGTVEITTASLAPLPGFTSQLCHGSGADTVIAVIRVTDGVVVATNDDYGGSLASKVTFTSTGAQAYFVVVKAYGAGTSFWSTCSNPGTASITAKLNGATVLSATNQVFGGVTLTLDDVSTGDVLLAGKRPNGAGWTPSPMYHDLMIHAFSLPGGWSCSSGSCGSSQSADDFDGQLLPRFDWSSLATTSPVVVLGAYGYNDYVPGGADPPKWVNARLMQLRRHVNSGGTRTCAENLDSDGDGLPFDLEEQLGTCDALDGSGTSTNVGIAGMACAQYRAFLDAQVTEFNGVTCPASIAGTCGRVPIVASNQPSNCWHPCDSDHDGLRDDEEVFVRRAGCQGTPDAWPALALPSCLRLHFGELLGGSYPTPLALALSAEDEPSPSTPDAFVEIDGIRVPLPGGGLLSTLPTASQVATLRSAYETTGKLCLDGSNPPCTWANQFDLSYVVRLHVILDQIHDLPYAPTRADVDFEGGVALAVPGFVRSNVGPARLSPLRKDLGIYRYGVTYWDEGGQASSRWFTVGNREQAPGEALHGFAHEIGHTLGLSHGHGTATSPTSLQCNSGATMTEIEHPAHVSLMSYQYQSAPPLTELGTGSPACSTMNIRFSKGQANWIFYPNPTPWAASESAPYEVHVSSETSSLAVKRLASDLRCWTRSQCPGEFLKRYAGSGCTASTCCHEWSGDGVCTPGSPAPLDIDLDDSWSAPLNGPGQDGNRVNDKVRDRNDWGNLLVTLDDAGGDGPPDLNSYVPLYAAGMNDLGGATTIPADFTGWAPATYTTSTAGQSTEAALETFRCAAASDCGGAPCLLDTCTPTPNCVAGQGCIDGVCSCTSDAQCRSGSCDLSVGKCGHTSWGTCTCFAPPTPPMCPQYQTGDYSWYGRALVVTSAAQSLTLNHQAPTMQPLAMATTAFEVRLDVRIDGFDGTPAARQTLLDTGNVRLVAEAFSSTYPNRSFFALRLLNTSGQVLVSMYATQNEFNVVDRWYRVRVVRDSAGHLSLEAKAWDWVNATKYGAPVNPDETYVARSCLTKLSASVTATPSSIRFGARVDGTEPMNGRLDNVSFYRGTRFEWEKRSCTAN